jgi:hypothetical protein
MNRPEKVFRERPKKNYNKVKGGNYHEYYNSHHSHRSVGFSVRRGRRLLLEKTTVGVVSHILTLYIGGGHEGGFGVITRFKKKHRPWSDLTNKNIPTPKITV